ncbi:recombination endonuclease VII protein [Rhizobium phage RHph_Y1_20]|uniref:Recombination endonuclease VII protein n=1 Tax=Rhizobium phage RHph_Y1_20 TaxID=2509571 RepID=A0A7S5UT66_9CAUD|nr:recombination endonuclease VII protein [Rhizobium phage RHph_Y1_20]
MLARRRIKTTEVAVVKKRLFDNQQGVCPLCKTRMTILSDACLDHDHDSGLLRDVLCRNCNGIEGKIKNLVTRARRGMAYKNYLGNVILYWIRHEEDRTGLYHPTHKSDDEKRLLRNKRARASRAKKKALA